MEDSKFKYKVDISKANSEVILNFICSVDLVDDTVHAYDTLENLTNILSVELYLKDSCDEIIKIEDENRSLADECDCFIDIEDVNGGIATISIEFSETDDYYYDFRFYEFYPVEDGISDDAYKGISDQSRNIEMLLSFIERYKSMVVRLK